MAHVNGKIHDKVQIACTAVPQIWGPRTHLYAAIHHDALVDQARVVGKPSSEAQVERYILLSSGGHTHTREGEGGHHSDGTRGCT